MQGRSLKSNEVEYRLSDTAAFLFPFPKLLLGGYLLYFQNLK
uniref:Uncharacterized protein n=1 Tax=Anguilla anguilla TaxID=7936 RepID=A0A0E9VAW3_ANGAN